ncbi:MAG: glycosyltransferase family 39 protein [Pelolinea sp.]|nr:glycosyltransferase family 39 protein [Pelolinea sp.]
MKLFRSLKDNKSLYWVILIVICVLFFFQAFCLAHQQPSKVDEGSFLIKGYLFISGRYKPFEDYGPWTNNMPLAYLIPGIPQFLFGPGLKMGRYFAMLVTFTTLIGVWALLRRLTGKWWALAAVFALSINPAWIGINVLAVSQALVACLVTWVMVLLLGEERKLWHICAAAFLSAAATLTRQNMVFLIPFVILYAWWRYGIKEAVAAFLFSIIPFVVVHAIYFPKIMTLWYTWLPKSIKTTFDVGFIDGGGSQVWRPGGDLIDRLSSFFTAVRYHFISLLGVCFAIPMIFAKKNWRSKNEWKLVFSLLILFAILFGLHGWASLTKNYCIFCFPNYVAFFIPIATIISFLAISRLVENKFSVPTVYVSAIYLFFIPGIFFGSIQTVGRWVMQLPFPRIKNGRLAGGVTQIWELFRNRFQMTYDQLIMFIPPVFGFLVALTLLILLLIMYRVLRKKLNVKFGFVLALSLLLFSVIFTPTQLIGKFSYENTCGGNVISAYEKAGQQLQKKIPDDASVYWGSGSVVTPLLYIADAGIQPLQLNGVYPKRNGGDRDLLEKNGYYNAESVRDWRDSADFILVQSYNMGDFWKNYLDPTVFDEYDPTVPIDPCDPNSAIQIFRRK